MAFDKQQAISQFVERKALNKGKTVDNSAAYAGSPMVYHCRHCEAHTQTLPEDHRQRPITCCAPCTEIMDSGCMPEALLAYAETGRPAWTKPVT